jgi:hypothetical protein
MSMMKLIYVAGPYRGPNALEIERNTRRAEELGVKVAMLGAMPMIPPANNRYFNGILDDRFWFLGNLEWMRRCDGAIFTRDWQRSSAARQEHDECERRGLPRFYTVEELQRWLGPCPAVVDPAAQLPLFNGVPHVAG